MRQRHSSTVALEILGAVCCSIIGTLVTRKLDASPEAALVAAAAGAAIAPLISAAGRHQPLRVGVGVFVTLLALGLTYGGFAVFDITTDQSPHLPLPGGVAGGPGGSSADGPAIRVKPESLELECLGRDCARRVRVISVGSEPLLIGAVELDGSVPGFAFDAGGCAHRRLSEVGDACTISVWAETPGTGGATTRLVIHQNLPGRPTFVRLTGPGTPLPTVRPTRSEPPEPTPGGTVPASSGGDG